jgi:hypothetical protein
LKEIKGSKEGGKLNQIKRKDTRQDWPKRRKGTDRRVLGGECAMASCGAACHVCAGASGWEVAGVSLAVRRVAWWGSHGVLALRIRQEQRVVRREKTQKKTRNPEQRKNKSQRNSGNGNNEEM